MCVADSLCYNIVGCPDIYVKMKERLDLFDTSDYPKDDSRGLYSDTNKKVLGVMKDEMNGQIAESFVGLRAKMYSLKVQGDGETNKAKG